MAGACMKSSWAWWVALAWLFSAAMQGSVGAADATPNIDALAKGGIRFQHCYLGSWCMPSRANLLTGRYPHAVESMRMEGEYPGSTYDPNQCPFWPRVFRMNGYQTAQIGKWHTGTDA